MQPKAMIMALHEALFPVNAVGLYFATEHANRATHSVPRLLPLVQCFVMHFHYHNAHVVPPKGMEAKS